MNVPTVDVTVDVTAQPDNYTHQLVLTEVVRVMISEIPQTRREALALGIKALQWALDIEHDDLLENRIKA